MDEAGEEITKLRENIERWYDDAMARVTGWYKRTTQLWTVGLAVIITIGLNVDTIEIANNLWRSPTLRASLIAASEKMLKEAPPIVGGGRPSTPETVKQAPVPVAPQREGQPPAKSSTTPPPSTSPTQQPVTQVSPEGASTIKPSPPTAQGGMQTTPQGIGTQTSSSGAKSEVEQIGEIVKQIQQLDQLPIGWKHKVAGTPPQPPTSPNNIVIPVPTFSGTLSKVFGWLLTALAISLGAPFWFDLLKKFMQLRGGGTEPQKQKQ
jgi:hypothetical protein